MSKRVVVKYFLKVILNPLLNDSFYVHQHYITVLPKKRFDIKYSGQRGDPKMGYFLTRMDSN